MAEEEVEAIFEPGVVNKDSLLSATNSLDIHWHFGSPLTVTQVVKLAIHIFTDQKVEYHSWLSRRLRCGHHGRHFAHNNRASVTVVKVKSTEQKKLESQGPV